MDCLKYAHEHGCPWDMWTCTYESTQAVPLDDAGKHVMAVQPRVFDWIRNSASVRLDLILNTCMPR